jgi:hypothetical protein
MTTGAPLYQLGSVCELIKKGMIRLATSDCVNDVHALDLDRQAVGVLIQQLTTSHFRKVYGPCDTSFGTFDADDYIAWIDVDSRTIVGEDDGLKVYIKISIAQTNSDGTQLLVVSFHPSRPSWG